MILIADSGSSKTHWALASATEFYVEQSEGLNPFFTDHLKVKQAVEKVVGKRKVDAVYFYGAGCNSDEKKEIIRQGVCSALGSVELLVESDLLGAARAAYAHNKGWIVILGTGSSVAYYDGNELIRYKPSLGFVLGDEGSGAYIGKLFLKKLLYNELSDIIVNDFYAQYENTISDILTNIYSKPYPNRYIAQFATFVARYLNYAEIRELITLSFDDLIKTHIIPFNNNNKPVSFVGSVAFAFKEVLLEVAINYNLEVQTVVQNPIQKLAEYHLKALGKF